VKYLKVSPVALCLQIRRDENWKGGRDVAEKKKPNDLVLEIYVFNTFRT